MVVPGEEGAGESRGQEQRGPECSSCFLEVTQGKRKAAGDYQGAGGSKNPALTEAVHILN